MKNKVSTILIALTFTGCGAYREQFTYYNDDNTPNHTVDVSFYTFFMMGKAGQLSTETQTMEFIRNVNATDVENRTDSNALGSFAEGVTKGIKKF